MGAFPQIPVSVDPGSSVFSFDVPTMYYAPLRMALTETIDGNDVLLASGVMSKTGTYNFNVTSQTGNLTLSFYDDQPHPQPLDHSLHYIWFVNPRWTKTVITPQTTIVQICNGGKDAYEFGYNGQMKTNEIAGTGNHNTAEFWEYDTRLARRWNTDPKPHIGISDYSAFGANPIFNSDPKGDYFFGLIGSTSAQRHAARDFAKKHDGAIKDLTKKSIHVSYTEGVKYPDAESSGGIGLMAIGKNQYFNSEDGSLASQNGEANVWHPDPLYFWGKSESFIGKFSYGVADDPYVFAQSLFLQHFNNGEVRHLNGDLATNKDRVSAMAGTATDLVPAGKFGTALRLEKVEVIALRDIFKAARLQGLSVSKYLEKAIEKNFRANTVRDVEKALEKTGKATNVYNAAKGDEEK